MVAMALGNGGEKGSAQAAGLMEETWALKPKASASPGARRASPARPAISKAGKKRSQLSLSVRTCTHARTPPAA
jgi:hypothetical protein